MRFALAMLAVAAAGLMVGVLAIWASQFFNIALGF